MTIKINLGTTSLSKKNIASHFFDSRFPKDIVNIFSVEVESDIPDQPLDEKTTIQGALNRAFKAHRILNENIDYSVGLEAGLCDVSNWGYYLVCVSVVIDAKGNQFVGVSSKIRLPLKVDREIRKGFSFGEKIREYQKLHKKEKKVQTILENLITRNKLFIQALEESFAQIENKKHYI